MNVAPFSLDATTRKIVEDMLTGRACWTCGAARPGSTTRHLCADCERKHLAGIERFKPRRTKKKGTVKNWRLPKNW